MDRRVAMPGVHDEGSAHEDGRDAWPPEDARDEWWEPGSSPTARERLLARRRASLRQIIRFLFVHGGISMVFLFGLMAYGLIAAFFQSR